MNVKKFASAFMSGLLMFTYFASSAMNEQNCLNEKYYKLVGNQSGVHRKKKSEHDDDDCAICQNNLEKSNYKYTLSCGHRYDMSCLREMLNYDIMNCPKCRSVLRPYDVNIISYCDCERADRLKLKLGKRFLVGTEPDIAVLPCCGKALHTCCLKKIIMDLAENGVYPSCPICNRPFMDGFLRNTLKLVCEQVARLQGKNLLILEDFTLAGPTISDLRDKIDALKNTNLSLKSNNKTLKLIIAFLIIIEAYQIYQMYFTK